MDKRKDCIFIDSTFFLFSCTPPGLARHSCTLWARILALSNPARGCLVFSFFLPPEYGPIGVGSQAGVFQSSPSACSKKAPSCPHVIQSLCRLENLPYTSVLLAELAECEVGFALRTRRVGWWSHWAKLPRGVVGVGKRRGGSRGGGGLPPPMRGMGAMLWWTHRCPQPSTSRTRRATATPRFPTGTASAAGRGRSLLQ